MREPQCWWNCKHAAGVSRGWYVPSKMITETDIYDSYCCENRCVIGTNAFYKEEAKTVNDISGKFVKKMLTQLVHIENADKFLSEDEETEAISLVNSSTAACRICRFHDYK